MEKTSTCKYEVIKQLLAENNEQENSGTFWWITKDISFHSNKIFFFTKRQVTLNFFRVNLRCSLFIEQANLTLLGSHKWGRFTLQSGPGKWFSWTSNGSRTMSLLGCGGIVWKLQKCTNQTRLDTKNSGWRNMPLIQE